MPLWVIDLFEVQSDSLGEVAQGFVDRMALAGDVDLKTLRHVPVFFLMYGGGQVPSGAHRSQCDTPHAVPSSLPRQGRAPTPRRVGGSRAACPEVAEAGPNVIGPDMTACLWEAETVDAVRDLVDSVVGQFSQNEYFEVSKETALGLPD